MGLRLALAAWSAVLALSLGAVARGAEVRLRADEACVEPSAIVDEVEGVIGRPLASVPGVVFEVEIARAGPHAWRLRLRTDDAGDVAEPNGSDTAAGNPPALRATRELQGTSCAEVASAAAVAIALSIQAASAEKAPTPPSPPATTEPSPASIAATAKPAHSDDAKRPRVSAAFLAVGDAGALPHVGVGGELDLAVERGSLRAVGLFSASAPQETSAGAFTGGQFTLIFGGLLACVSKQRTSLTAVACAGGELGRIIGEGTGSTHPRVGSALWAAGRAELGVDVPIAPDWALVVRLAAGYPFVRPDFQINGAVHVYTPAPVTGRVGVGLQLTF